ncbi:hypothetical protein L6R52_23370 [Myxococcota bacterium]|nr:hypothetical protein [Myxococcota bacterium]
MGPSTLCSLFLTVSLVAQPIEAARVGDREFRGCGPDAQAARATLAANIAANVRAAFLDRQSHTEGKNGVGSSASVRSELAIESEVPLVGVRIEEGAGGQVCAIQGYSELRGALAVRLEQIPQCDRGLPEDDRAKSTALNSCLQTIREARALAPLFHPELTESQRRTAMGLDAVRARVEQALSSLNPQSLRFDVSTPGARVSIGDREQPLQRKITWPTGQVRYVVTAPGYCALEATAEVKALEDKVITVDLSKRTLPRVTFESNDPQASLRINGHGWNHGAPYQSSTCEGVLAYEATLHGAESVKGTVPLHPGQDQKVSLDFVRPQDRKHLARTAQAFVDTMALRAAYSIGVPLHSEVRAVALHTMRADVTWAYHALRYGGGVAYGFAKGDVQSFEGFGVLALQLTDVGGGQPIHFGRSVALVPYLSVDLGFGYHGIQRDVENTERGDFGGFRDSHIIARGSLGTFLTLNPYFAISLEGSYDLTMEQPLAFMAGAQVHFGVKD